MAELAMAALITMVLLPLVYITLNVMFQLITGKSNIVDELIVRFLRPKNGGSDDPYRLYFHDIEIHG